MRCHRSTGYADLWWPDLDSEWSGSHELHGQGAGWRQVHSEEALPLGKRLGFPGLADVQLVKESSVGKEAEQDAALMEQVAAVRSTNPDHEKFLKLHLQVTQTLPRLPGQGAKPRISTAWRSWLDGWKSTKKSR